MNQEQADTVRRALVKENALFCSFCGKNQRNVRIVAGPCVYICNECLAVCNEIVGDNDPPVAVRGIW